MQNDQVIFINRQLKNSQYVLLAIFFAGLLAVYFWVPVGPGLFSWMRSPVSIFFYVLFFICLFTVNHINQGKKIIFSVTEQAVFSQTVVGRKHLMNFADVGTVNTYSTGFGVTYMALFRRDNLYGRNPIRISPNFADSAKGRKQFNEFERSILPDIQVVIAFKKANQGPIIHEADLIYYRKDKDTYWLKQTYGRDKLTWLLIGFLVVGSIYLFITPGLTLRYLNHAIGLLLAALILTFIHTEKKRFKREQLISDYTNGMLRKTYLLSQFDAFEIIHRKYNFIYVGTDINLVINGKSVFLCQLRKTSQIEAFINETKYVMAKQTS